jgi:hypothetical protein
MVVHPILDAALAPSVTGTGAPIRRHGGVQETTGPGARDLRRRVTCRAAIDALDTAAMMQLAATPETTSPST